jgi:hypothetical protein
MTSECSFLGTKRIPLLETLPEDITCLAFLFVAGGCLLACDSIEPTDYFIRRTFTAISTAPRAATAVKISFMICCSE